jgi:hypothetical protein
LKFFPLRIFQDERKSGELEIPCAVNCYNDASPMMDYSGILVWGWGGRGSRCVAGRLPGRKVGPGIGFKNGKLSDLSRQAWKLEVITAGQGEIQVDLNRIPDRGFERLSLDLDFDSRRRLWGRIILPGMNRLWQPGQQKRMEYPNARQNLLPIGDSPAAPNHRHLFLWRVPNMQNSESKTESCRFDTLSDAFGRAL